MAILLSLLDCNVNCESQICKRNKHRGCTLMAFGLFFFFQFFRFFFHVGRRKKWASCQSLGEMRAMSPPTWLSYCWLSITAPGLALQEKGAGFWSLNDVPTQLLPPSFSCPSVTTVANFAKTRPRANPMLNLSFFWGGGGHAVLCDMWNISSPTRDGIHAPCIGSVES